MKKVSLNLSVFLLLVVGLTLSLLANVLQVTAAKQEDTLTLTGSYGEAEAGPAGASVYVVFDSAGHYCKYSPIEGLLHEGRYEQIAQNQYRLTGQSGEIGQVLLKQEGIYDISADEELSVMFLPRFSDVPTFVGQWTESWPGWQK